MKITCKHSFSPRSTISQKFRLCSRRPGPTGNVPLYFCLFFSINSYNGTTCLKLNLRFSNIQGVFIPCEIRHGWGLQKLLHTS